MRRRINMVVMAVLVILAILVWAVAKNQRNTIKSAAASVPVVPTVTTAPPAKIEVLILPAPQPAAAVESDRSLKHIAQPGETVTSLATDLLGKDSKTNRDAIINSNSSLKADPDHLVAGKVYRIPSATEAPAVAVSPVVQAPAVIPVQPSEKQAANSEPVKELKYTAAPGDTVTNLAGAFLGNDDKAHQDAIVNANSSLKADPDRVVAGQAYRIPAPDGLSAATPAALESSPRPTTQPDADQVVVAGSPRTLRYTAVAGDTVTSLAIALLGSDTQEARDTIINSNPSLKKDPDRVLVGQTYWIPAPAAATAKP
jgi:nucleoid-associated protein YgaU